MALFLIVGVVVCSDIFTDNTAEAKQQTKHRVLRQDKYDKSIRIDYVCINDTVYIVNYIQ